MSINLGAGVVDGSTLTFSLVSGALPAGVTLSSAGVLSGTITAYYPADTVFNFTIRVTANNDPYRIADRNFSMTLKALTLAFGTAANVSFADTSPTALSVAATANAGSVSYSLISGTLPSGCSLNTNTGSLGTTNTVTQDTISTFTIRATSSLGGIYIERTFTVTVVFALDGSTIARAATSATSIKTLLGSPSNGSRYYTLSSGTVQLYTDFTSYSNYPMVLVTRISPNDQNQYLTTSNNQGDLSSTPNNTTPTRSAKISDADMNTIISTNSIRWAIVGPGMTFYRLPKTQAYYSNFGQSQSCGYSTNLQNAYSTPSNNPSWIGFANFQGACGAGYDSSSNWLSLTGIHTNDGTYFGGYSGSSPARASTVSPYTTTGGDSVWSSGGYVFLSF